MELESKPRPLLFHLAAKPERHGSLLRKYLTEGEDPECIDKISIENRTCDGFSSCLRGLSDRKGRIRIISARKAKNEEINEYYRDYDVR